MCVAGVVGLSLLLFVVVRCPLSGVIVCVCVVGGGPSLFAVCCPLCVVVVWFALLNVVVVGCLWLVVV